jgi:glycogen operon protein
LHSVNMITCHDGFTLCDLVSYNEKHNQANGEGNRDGHNDNASWNCGVEGDTDDPEILAIRKRQARNLMATLLLSQGVPMILAGDEFLRTQKGNNNAWCQDNEVSWLDWRLAEDNADFLRFTKEMIGLRKRHPALRRRRFFTGEIRRGSPGYIDVAPAEAGPFPESGPVRPSEAGLPPGSKVTPLPGRNSEWRTPAPVTTPTRLADIHWHGVEPYQPDFGHYSRVLAFTLDGRFTGREHDDDYQLDADFYVAMNAWSDPLPFRIPPSPTRRKWHLVVDTAKPPPHDFTPEGKGPTLPAGSHYEVAGHSLVVLVSEG